MGLAGVNLGGWLILEKWITPSLFEGTGAFDEHTLCVSDAANGYGKLTEHRNKFITLQDFRWLSKAGFNAVRIPLGYWALDDDPPYLNCSEKLDEAFSWAAGTGLQIVLDLHGAPGSQNGQDHSGRIGPIEWPNEHNLTRTLHAVGCLSRRYAGCTALKGISLLNEPSPKIPTGLLVEYYIKGYELVRSYCDESVAVIISDGFQPDKWNGIMVGPYRNVILDIHLYQCFSKKDKSLGCEDHLKKARDEWCNLIRRSDKPVIVGEWSLGLDPATFRGFDDDQVSGALKKYADVQAEVFADAAGSFFWTYKTEDESGWNLRKAVEAGVIQPLSA